MNPFQASNRVITHVKNIQDLCVQYWLDTQKLLLEFHGLESIFIIFIIELIYFFQIFYGFTNSHVLVRPFDTRLTFLLLIVLQKETR